MAVDGPCLFCVLSKKRGCEWDVAAATEVIAVGLWNLVAEASLSTHSEDGQQPWYTFGSLRPKH